MFELSFVLVINVMIFGQKQSVIVLTESTICLNKVVCVSVIIYCVTSK